MNDRVRVRVQRHDLCVLCVLCVFVYFFLRVAVSASCQEPCCPAHIMFFHCVTLLCYAPDVEQIKMMMMMIDIVSQPYQTMFQYTDTTL